MCPRNTTVTLFFAWTILTPPTIAEPVTYSQPMMGTVVRIVVASSEDKEAERHARGAFAEITHLASLLSEWETESEVSRVNRLASTRAVRISDELQGVLNISLSVAATSNGAFDPTWAALQTLHIDSTPEERRGRSTLVDWQQVALDTSTGTVRFLQPFIQLGLGGVAKGYIADRAAEYLRAQGLTNFIVDAGGDLVVSGQRTAQVPWKLAIQHPREPEQILGIVNPDNGAVVTSGDYERYTQVHGQRVHHILDPRIGDVAQKSIAVSIRAPKAALADALSTAVFVLGPKDGLELLVQYQKTYGSTVAGIIVGRNGHISKSQHANRYFTLNIERITVTP